MKTKKGLYFTEEISKEMKEVSGKKKLTFNLSEGNISEVFKKAVTRNKTKKSN